MSRVKIAVMIAAALAASGCGFLKKSAPKTPTLGERIPVLASELDVAVDEATAALPMNLPSPVANTEWSQSGGNAAKAMGHLALGNDLGQAFRVSIGAGSNLKARLASAPVVADGRVYTIDTMARVRAFSADTGAQIWEHQVRGENSPRETLYGGGVSYDSGHLYVTNGAGDVAALNAATGEQEWIVKKDLFDRTDTSILSDAISSILSGLLPPQDPTKGILVVRIYPIKDLVTPVQPQPQYIYGPYGNLVPVAPNIFPPGTAGVTPSFSQAIPQP